MPTLASGCARVPRFRQGAPGRRSCRCTSLARPPSSRPAARQAAECPASCGTSSRRCGAPGATALAATAPAAGGDACSPTRACRWCRACTPRRRCWSGPTPRSPRRASASTTSRSESATPWPRRRPRGSGSTTSSSPSCRASVGCCARLQECSRSASRSAVGCCARLWTASAECSQERPGPGSPVSCIGAAKGGSGPMFRGHVRRGKASRLRQ
mmetsp:Transcript_120034/g.322222  ORF Transcript_120034/g.322222 Transcript_120034/m.322222 type:complete len:213 (-) Transcript_120034:3-641(-)